MINLDFNNPVAQVRLNIGDPNGELITDSSLQSALNKVNNNVFTASVIVMEAMKSMFSTFADREREGGVEVYYTKLFERYSKLLEDFKRNGSDLSPANRPVVPIIIGGTSVKTRVEVVNNLDSFSYRNLPNWNDAMDETANTVYSEWEKLNNG